MPIDRGGNGGPRHLYRSTERKTQANKRHKALSDSGGREGNVNVLAQPSAELQRFRCGELTESEYLLSRIEQATLHLQGRVSLKRLSRIRKNVVVACTSDPVLVTLKDRLLRSRKKP